MIKAQCADLNSIKIIFFEKRKKAEDKGMWF
jgi:hypothetical protein